jgi:hypothetical protein
MKGVKVLQNWKPWLEISNDSMVVSMWLSSLLFRLKTYFSFKIGQLSK